METVGRNTFEIKEHVFGIDSLLLLICKNPNELFRDWECFQTTTTQTNIRGKSEYTKDISFLQLHLRHLLLMQQPT